MSLDWSIAYARIALAIWITRSFQDAYPSGVELWDLNGGWLVARRAVVDDAFMSLHVEGELLCYLRFAGCIGVWEESHVIITS